MLRLTVFKLFAVKWPKFTPKVSDLGIPGVPPRNPQIIVQNFFSICVCALILSLLTLSFHEIPIIRLWNLWCVASSFLFCATVSGHNSAPYVYRYKCNNLYLNCIGGKATSGTYYYAHTTKVEALCNGNVHLFVCPSVCRLHVG